MDLQSVKTRFMGSYFLLLVLFIIQIPVIYVLVGSMSEKYYQVEEAGSLRKRAAEITEILNRHIMTGNEQLDQLFQTKKEEYGHVIEGLRKGTASMPSITDPEILKDLETVEAKWATMKSALDKAMEHGDGFRENKAAIEESAAPFADRISAVAQQIDARHSALASQEKMRAIRLSYLFERYIVSYQDREAVASEINSNIAAMDSGLARLKEAGFERGGHAAEAARDVEKQWLALKEHMLTGMKSNDAYHSKISELVDVHTPQIVGAANGLTKKIAEHAKASAFSGIMVLAVSVIICGALAGYFMLMAKRQVISPIIKIKEMVNDLAKGDFTKRSEVKVVFLGKEINDEISDLGKSVDSMALQMSGIIGRITDTSNMLASASEQLSSSSSQISEGADRQSSQTTQIATAMEEMNATVVEVAKNSQQASDSARVAQEIATRGGDVVELAISAMQEVAESTSVTADTIKKLGKSSEEIGTIVSVINDIADQTNLLALNAAIEAARAGEQGRGFAVVADEVRKLAERTTKATKEISGMIKSIQDETSKAVEAMSEGTLKVENGVKLANEAGDSLKQIVSGVENVTDMISHIATSAEEQSATTDEITQNMDSIASVAKSNVMSIGEVAKATNELANLASELKDLVSNFKIAKESAAPSRGSVAEVHNFQSKKRFEPRLLTIENA